MYSVDFTNLDELRRAFGARPVQQALNRTINRQLQRLRTRAVRAVTAEYTASAAAVRKTFTIDSARGSDDEGELVSEGKRVPLIEFEARQTAKGVTFQIKRAGGRKMIPGSFITALQSGKVGVFRRGNKKGEMPDVGNARDSKGRLKRGRLPISLLESLAVPQMVAKPEVLDQLYADVEENFAEDFGHNLDFYLGLV